MKDCGAERIAEGSRLRRGEWIAEGGVDCGGEWGAEW